MRIILMALALLAATPARAEWTEVGRTAISVFYLDYKTVRKDGNLRSAWELHDLTRRGPEGELSVRLLHEYDCHKKRSRLLTYSDYSGSMATGEILKTESDSERWYDIVHATSDDVMTNVVRATAGDFMFRVVCS